MAPRRARKILGTVYKGRDMLKINEGTKVLTQHILKANKPWLNGINCEASWLKGTASTIGNIGHLESENYTNGGTPNFVLQNLGFDGAQTLPEFPYSDLDETNLGVPSVADGLKVDGHNGRIINCRIRNYRGSGVNHVVTSDTDSGDITMLLLESVRATHCWIGFRTRYIDSQIYNCSVCDVADFCWLDEQGNSQTGNNHFYGSRVAVQWGYDWNQPQEGVISESIQIGANKSVNDIFADTPIGLRNWKSNRANVVGARFHHCWDTSAYLYAPTRLVESVVKVPMTTTGFPTIKGVVLAGPSQVFTGQIELNEEKLHGHSGYGSGTAYGMEIQNNDHIVNAEINYRTEEDSQGQIGAWFHNFVIGPNTFKVNGGRFKFHIRSLSSMSNCWGVKIDSNALGSDNIIEVHGPWASNLISLPPNWNSSGSNKLFLNGDQHTGGALP